MRETDQPPRDLNDDGPCSTENGILESPNANRPPQLRSNGSPERGSLQTSNASNTLLAMSPPKNGHNHERFDDLPSFYGMTSHPHVGSPVEALQPLSTDEVVALGIDLDPNSLHLRDHLLQSYFKYQTLWVDIVDKQCFSSSREHGTQSRWYSDFLENSMLACATRLSTSKAVRALGPRYLSSAKDEAMKAMCEPTPASLQGFLLLSEYEVTQGVACRMLSDLGLHELSDKSGKSGETQKESVRESDLAYALLSACIVYEGVWTLYLGRPSSIPRSIINIAALRCKAQHHSDSRLLNAWLGLCVPMAEITHILNDQCAGESATSSSLPHFIAQIQDWYDNLPEELTYNESHLTNLNMAGYGLHTQYCKVQILLRQALARCSNPRKRRYSQVSVGLPKTSPDDSDRTIFQYSLRVARLVVTYREVFGVEKIPSIMLDNAVVAASAMMEYLNKMGSTGNIQQEAIWVQPLVKSMEAVQPHFPIIKRMLHALEQMSIDQPLSSMLPRANSTVANSFPPQPSKIRNSPSSMASLTATQQYPGRMPIGLDNIGATFGEDMSPGAFFWGGLDDIFPELNPTATPVSNMPQAVLS
ncbi:hypothetical protein H2202_002947 [Exophiala xenobiotica]|nr:hypothetical protein H2202_002947 [Exophiala xenobiotica]KAK5207782.1 hypothetical protein LTR41_006294 [Exophiala xenobiotica]KAK5219858.1 hypothetical protein LTR72_007389 [Exophiala xenobiotica]KAK5233125.1 hypothetical protein LTR47_005989 [Exophiala xenobiotica]KAK5243762.1 hypothetical protein LTS06_010551 [Exophiala xenobiotica]